jgi:hypothetical protein
MIKNQCSYKSFPRYFLFLPYSLFKNILLRVHQLWLLVAMSAHQQNQRSLSQGLVGFVDAPAAPDVQ